MQIIVCWPALHVWKERWGDRFDGSAFTVKRYCVKKCSDGKGKFVSVMSICPITLPTSVLMFIRAYYIHLYLYIYLFIWIVALWIDGLQHWRSSLNTHGWFIIDDKSNDAILLKVFTTTRCPVPNHTFLCGSRLFHSLLAQHWRQAFACR